MNLWEIAQKARNPHADDPRKQRVYGLLREKYEEMREKELKPHRLGSLDYDYMGHANAQIKWARYIKSLGMSFGKDGVLDPSCHLEWERRFILVSDDLVDKILTLGLP